MSALLAVFGTAVQGLADPELHDLLATMAYRGDEEIALWRSPVVALGTTRDYWELDPGFAGPTLIASRGPFHAICDATLYYKEDLRSRLRGASIETDSDPAADLIVAAYVAFGTDCVHYLEGDFAFCIWDAQTRTLFSARDPFGTRTLFHMEWGDTHYVASTPHPLVQCQGSRAAFDPAGVLRAILMRSGDGTATGWRGISELPAGHTLQATTGRAQVSRYWNARGSEVWRALDAAEAAETLAHLLEEATRQRQDASSTALAMSGGQDSTAILASMDHSHANAGRSPIHIISLKYPPGDSGNEDWYVDLVAERFGLPVHWVDTAEIPLFGELESRSRQRSSPLGHIFEGQNRALAASARELGSRVLLNGLGGDHLLAVSDYKMADLFRQGRWFELRRYARTHGYRGLKNFLNLVVRPATPLWLMDLAELLRGRPICSRPFERPIPPWVTADDRMLAELRRADRADYAASIMGLESTIFGRLRVWALMYSGFPRVCASLFDMKRAEGVELRLPFYDQRLVKFVLSRPHEDLHQPGGMKSILRRAMAGKLPVRQWKAQAGGLKPGTTQDYSEARFNAEAPRVLEYLSQRPWISEHLGIVERARFVDALRNRHSTHWPRMDFSLVFLAETWLQQQTVSPLVWSGR